jgi:hypothetical protein
MSNNEARTAATFFIWVAFTLVGIATIVNASEIGGIIFLIMVLLVGGAAGATQQVWKNAGSEIADAEKNKRRSKLDRMLERLDDGDIEELRSRLSADSDGEVVPLDDLLRRRG